MGLLYLLYNHMPSTDTTRIEPGSFYLAVFGAASILSIVIALLLSFLFSLLGEGLSLSSIVWVFLFLFPAALVSSALFIAEKLGIESGTAPLSGVIVGYGAYSLSSLFVMLIGSRSEPALWALIILLLVSYAIFNSERLFDRFNLNEDEEKSTETAIAIDSSVIPTKEEISKKGGAIVSIRQDREEERAAEDPAEGRVEGSVIHLGPRK